MPGGLGQFSFFHHCILSSHHYSRHSISIEKKGRNNPTIVPLFLKGGCTCMLVYGLKCPGKTNKCGSQEEAESSGNLLFILASSLMPPFKKLYVSCLWNNTSLKINILKWATPVVLQAGPASWQETSDCTSRWVPVYTLLCGGEGSEHQLDSRARGPHSPPQA